MLLIFGNFYLINSYGQIHCYWKNLRSIVSKIKISEKNVFERIKLLLTPKN